MTRRKPRQPQASLNFFAAIVATLSVALFFLEILPTPSHAETPMVEMTEEQLKSQVAERYQALFGKLYLQNPVDHSYISMPAIPAKDFKITGETNTVWHLAHDPLVGVIVRASVSKTSGLVQFDAVDLAVE